MKGLQRLLRFFAEHGDVLLEVSKWDKAEYGALIAGMIDSWCDFHDEDAVKMAQDIAEVIKEKHDGGEANG